MGQKTSSVWDVFVAVYKQILKYWCYSIRKMILYQNSQLITIISLVTNQQRFTFRVVFVGLTARTNVRNVSCWGGSNPAFPQWLGMGTDKCMLIVCDFNKRLGLHYRKILKLYVIPNISYIILNCFPGLPVVFFWQERNPPEIVAWCSSPGWCAAGI